MRTRFVLVALILPIVFGAQNLMGKKTAIPSKLSVRQQVDSEVDNLKKNLKAAKSMDAKWKYFEKTFLNIKTLRANSSRQFEGDEIHMDMQVASLDDIPKGTKFQASKCGEYKTTLIVHYNPRQEAEPDPAVTQTLHVLEILCNTKK